MVLVQVFVGFQGQWTQGARPGGGGTQIWVDRGVTLEPQNPYPSLRVILAKKGTHF